MLQNIPKRLGTRVVVTGAGGTHRPHEFHLLTLLDHHLGRELRSTVRMENRSAAMVLPGEPSPAQRLCDKFGSHMIGHREAKHPTRMFVLDRIKKCFSLSVRHVNDVTFRDRIKSTLVEFAVHQIGRKLRLVVRNRRNNFETARSDPSNPHAPHGLCHRVHADLLTFRMQIGGDSW